MTLKEKILNLSMIILGGFISIVNSVGQTCPIDQPTGQSLICNGDFELLDSCFTSPDHGNWNDPVFRASLGRNHSESPEYYVHDDPDDFNSGAFAGSNHTPGGSLFMMVDGACWDGVSQASKPIVWEQTVDVVANTNYYFSVWISSLKSGVSLAQLEFEVNGMVLPTVISAPNATNTWIQFIDSINTGATSGPIVIRILNNQTTGCGDGNDFGLDDITFTAGCQFGSAGNIPDFGPDQTLCGTDGSITLDPNLPAGPTYTYLWDDGTTGPTRADITSTGFYSVCVTTDGSCMKSDVIEITNDFAISLGPDVELCSPPEATLNAGFTGVNVTYQWYKDNVAINGATAQTYTANETGTYKVETTDISCGTREDEVIITTQALQANNGIFCPATSPDASLSVVDEGGNYVWYDAPTGGNQVSDGPTFLATGLSASTTYYVEDTSTFSYHVGPVGDEPIDASQSAATFVDVTCCGSTNDPNHYVDFTVYTDLVIDSVTVYPLFIQFNPFDVGIEIVEVTGGVPGTSQGNTVTSFPAGGSPNSGDPKAHGAYQVPVGISLTPGTYRMLANGQQIFRPQGTGVPTPLGNYQVAGVIEMTDWENRFGSDDQWAMFFDWVVSSGAICDRTPVEAILDCGGCVNPDAAGAISDPGAFCGFDTTTYSISAVNNATDYTWTVPTNATILSGQGTISITVAHGGGSGNVTVTPSNSCGNGAGSSLSQTPLSTPTVIVGSDQVINAVQSITLDGTGSSTGGGITYLWTPSATVVDPSAITTSADPLSSTCYKLTVDNGSCAAVDSTCITVQLAIDVPTGFSPNGDGINDYWEIDNIDLYPDVVIKVFNRWGSIVFESNGYTEMWDGKRKGEELPDAVYYWTLDLNDGSEPLSGSLTIIK